MFRRPVSGVSFEPVFRLAAMNRVNSNLSTSCPPAQTEPRPAVANTSLHSNLRVATVPGKTPRCRAGTARGSVCILAATVVSVLVLSTACSPAARTAPAASTQPAKKLFEYSERELDAYLQSQSGTKLTVPQRAAQCAKQLIGQPYKLYLLGEFPHELIDPDPLYCLSASDCVTFVEHVYAMALGDDWQSFFDALLRLRYKDGKVGMLTRNHFTEADWNINNAWVFEDVTRSIAPKSIIPMHQAVDRASFFRKYNIGQDIPIEPFETTFLPGNAVKNAQAQLKTGDIIEIVRGTAEAPFVGHMGLIAGRDTRGRPMLIHSADPKVREEPLLDYLASSGKIRGIKVLRYRETK